jgi:hypothetical protein
VEITDEVELKSGKLLEISRTSLNHLPSGVGQVMSRSPTRALNRTKKWVLEMTYRDFRKAGESLWVPSWSTSLRIPRTLLSILNTCMDREDWRFAKAASSGDCVFLTGDSIFDRPASTSWKLMAEVWAGGFWSGNKVVLA